MKGSNATRLLAASLLLFALAAYAIEQTSAPRWAFHNFNFGSVGIPENTGVEILAYQYGDSKVPGTYEEGHNLRWTNVGGRMPVADFLYVKWRVLATGTVYENRVNLKRRLPSNMENKTIHFIVDGPKINVYLIINKEGNKPGSPDCPVHLYFHNKCTRIYPDHWSNF
ncbi:MAG TPA: hypothetical protein VMH80_03785 [Bryobacteraceae bacterium]|nr:hypothetical protein [Bryobacteraceae bacterium]